MKWQGEECRRHACFAILKNTSFADVATESFGGALSLIHI